MKVAVQIGHDKCIRRLCFILYASAPYFMTVRFPAFIYDINKEYEVPGCVIHFSTNAWKLLIVVNITKILDNYLISIKEISTLRLTNIQCHLHYRSEELPTQELDVIYGSMTWLSYRLLSEFKRFRPLLLFTTKQEEIFWKKTGEWVTAGRDSLEVV